MAHLQAVVGERADGEWHLLLHQSSHDRIILPKVASGNTQRERRCVATAAQHKRRPYLQAPHTMIDALHFQHVERLRDVGGRPLLTRVGDDVQVQIPALREHACELLGRVVLLATVQAHPQDGLQEGPCSLQRLERRLLRVMAQEAHDQAGFDVKGGLGVLLGADQAIDHGLERDAPVSVCLRIEENLGVANTILGRTLEVRHGEVVEVLLVDQLRGTRRHVSVHRQKKAGNPRKKTHHRACSIVNVEEALQIAKVAGSVGVLEGGIPGVKAVSLGDLEHELRLKCPLDVEMQLRFRHAASERRWARTLPPAGVAAGQRSGGNSGGTGKDKAVHGDEDTQENEKAQARCGAGDGWESLWDRRFIENIRNDSIATLSSDHHDTFQNALTRT